MGLIPCVACKFCAKNVARLVTSMKTGGPGLPNKNNIIFDFVNPFLRFLGNIFLFWCLTHYNKCIQQSFTFLGNEVSFIFLDNEVTWWS